MADNVEGCEWGANAAGMQDKRCCYTDPGRWRLTIVAEASVTPLNGSSRRQALDEDAAPRGGIFASVLGTEYLVLSTCYGVYVVVEPFSTTCTMLSPATAGSNVMLPPLKSQSTNFRRSSWPPPPRYTADPEVGTMLQFVNTV